MEKQLNDNISQIEKKMDDRFDQIDKRINDIKKYPSFVLTAVGIVFISFAVFTGLSLDSEKETLQRLKTELVERVNTALGHIEKEPEVELLSEIGAPIEGSTLPAAIKDISDGNVEIGFSFTIKNKGNKSTDPMFLKFYFREPMLLALSEKGTSDEKDYDSEALFEPERIVNNGIFPAGLSSRLKVAFALKGFKPEHIPYPVLVKVYYGGEKHFAAKFLIELKH